MPSADFPMLLSLEDAQQRIVSVCTPRQMGRESVPLHKATSRVLAEDVRTNSDIPSFDNSAMDGIAMRSEDLPGEGTAQLHILGSLLAGDCGHHVIGAGQCMRIMTGARMPQGADTVVIKERVRVESDCAVVGAGEVIGSHVRRRGEEMERGQIALHRGQRIGFAQLSALASLGLDRVPVHRQPRVSIISTGDELVMPGQACDAAQIYNSNGFGLAAMLAAGGAELQSGEGNPNGPPFRHVRDDRAALEQAVLDAVGKSDVIVTTGGVSAGEADYLPELVRSMGRVHFWKVRLRPGMPFLFGEVHGALVFCLPGNPVSSLVTFQSLVRPALRVLQGDTEWHPAWFHAQLCEHISKRHERTEMMRGRLESAADGTLRVRTLAKQGSAMISGMLAADVLVELPESVQVLEAGQVVRVHPLRHD